MAPALCSACMFVSVPLAADELKVIQLIGRSGVEVISEQPFEDPAAQARAIRACRGLLIATDRLVPKKAKVGK